MIMILLDGEMAEESILDPAKHRFLGSFRKPFSIPHDIYDIYMCDCGRSLWTIEECREHWALGHWDILQYITIKE